MSPGKEIGDFKADLKRFAKQIDTDFTTVFKKIVFEAYTRFVQRSPVDSGRFRASWTVQESTPNLTTKAPGSYSGAPPIPPYTVSQPYTIVWIANALPYAERLEFGWSKQAPQGMVRLTLAELTSYINRIASMGVPSV